MGISFHALSCTDGEGSVQLTSFVLTSLQELTCYIEIKICIFYKTGYLNEKVKCTEPSPSVFIHSPVSSSLQSEPPPPPSFPVLSVFSI